MTDKTEFHVYCLIGSWILAAATTNTQLTKLILSIIL